jgi:hypothetical protein
MLIHFVETPNVRMSISWFRLAHFSSRFRTCFALLLSRPLVGCEPTETMAVKTNFIAYIQKLVVQ